MRNLIIVVVVAVAAAGLYFWSSSGSSDGTGSSLAEVKVPELGIREQAGMEVFNEVCAVCHGENAAGRDGAGPPLVHVIYEPNHHGDGSFQLAVKNGVRAHHWPFGNMPPQPQVSENEVDRVTAYVRALQRANGIN
jgi:mono/diheme cytochrome c family protein